MIYIKTNSSIFVNFTIFAKFKLLYNIDLCIFDILGDVLILMKANVAMKFGSSLELLRKFYIIL